MTTLSSTLQTASMDNTKKVHLRCDHGGHKPCFFRPPYGAYNGTTVTLTRNRGMSVTTWSKTLEIGNAPVSQRHVLKHDCFQSEEPAELPPDILMHDGSPADHRQNTVNSVQHIIALKSMRLYKSRGCKFTNPAGR